jgi:hypothetical protein
LVQVPILISCLSAWVALVAFVQLLGEQRQGDALLCVLVMPPSEGVSDAVMMMPTWLSSRVT